MSRLAAACAMFPPSRSSPARKACRTRRGLRRAGSRWASPAASRPAAHPVLRAGDPCRVPCLRTSGSRHRWPREGSLPPRRPRAAPGPMAHCRHRARYRQPAAKPGVRASCARRVAPRPPPACHPTRPRQFTGVNNEVVYTSTSTDVLRLPATAHEADAHGHGSGLRVCLATFRERTKATVRGGRRCGHRNGSIASSAREQAPEVSPHHGRAVTHDEGSQG